MAVGILGIAYHLPERVETVADLRREHPDWQMDALYESSGIFARHIAAEGETASDLGYHAAVRVLDQSLVDTSEIDYLLYCTQCPDYFMPAGACILQNRLGLGQHVGSLDYNLGCSGFVYGLQLGKSLIISGFARYVLLITADTISKVICQGDRSVRALFGDAATATLLGPADTGKRIGKFVVGSDGAGAEKLIVPSGGFRMPRSPDTARETTDDHGCTRSKDHLFMDGSAMFAFAITRVPRLLEALLAKAELTADQIDWFVFHQANKYLLEQLALRSKIPREKMVLELESVGNTASSSIPIAIQRWADAGKIRSGQRLVLAGFGTGYSWGACDIAW
jgi:3-oxoacyl-[acyl-carrier-protein] synthase-3